MKHTTQPIPLKPSIATNDARPIKYGALAVFRLLRSGIDKMKQWADKLGNQASAA